MRRGERRILRPATGPPAGAPVTPGLHARPLTRPDMAESASWILPRRVSNGQNGQSQVYQVREWWHQPHPLLHRVPVHHEINLAADRCTRQLEATDQLLHGDRDTVFRHRWPPAACAGPVPADTDGSPRPPTGRCRSGSGPTDHRSIGASRLRRQAANASFTPHSKLSSCLRCTAAKNTTCAVGVVSVPRRCPALPCHRGRG